MVSQSCFISTVLMTCYAGSAYNSHSALRYQLLTLDSGHSGLACLLVFSAAEACDCPQTVRQLLVQRIVVLFAAGSWLG